DIFRHVGADHGCLRAQCERLEHRHRRAHAIGAGDVAGRGYHAALAAADDDGLVGDVRVVALLDGGVERVAVDMRERARGERAMPHQPRRAAMAAAARLEVETAEAVPAKAGRAIRRWRGRAHGTSRSQRGSPSTSRAAAMLVGCSSDAFANAVTLASSRSTKSSTLARKRGSAAELRKVSGPIPLSARNSPSRSGSAAMKLRA